MTAKREQAYGDLLVIKSFTSNYARDLLYYSRGDIIQKTFIDIEGFMILTFVCYAIYKIGLLLGLKNWWCI